METVARFVLVLPSLRLQSVPHLQKTFASFLVPSRYSKIFTSLLASRVVFYGALIKARVYGIYSVSEIPREWLGCEM